MNYEINEQKCILDYKCALDYGLMMRYIDVFMRRYDFLGVTSIGCTVMGKSIPMITLGKGKSAALYVGAPRAGEWLTSIVLLRFINEYCELYKNKNRIYNNTLDYLYSEKTVYIVPMLNADGVDYRINGVNDKNILYDRLLRMNEESGTDFSAWEANGRGVELSFNYNFDFGKNKKIESDRGIFGGAPSGYSGTSPESEPEIGALCNFLRFNASVEGVVSLGVGENTVSCSLSEEAKRYSGTAGRLSRMSGYSLESESAGAGGFSEWCMNELSVPVFEIKCGGAPKAFSADVPFKIYADLREPLFRFPFVI